MRQHRVIGLVLILVFLAAPSFAVGGFGVSSIPARYPDGTYFQQLANVAYAWYSRSRYAIEIEAGLPQFLNFAVGDLITRVLNNRGEAIDTSLAAASAADEQVEINSTVTAISFDFIIDLGDRQSAPDAPAHATARRPGTRESAIDVAFLRREKHKPVMDCTPFEPKRWQLAHGETDVDAAPCHHEARYPIQQRSEGEGADDGQDRCRVVSPGIRVVGEQQVEHHELEGQRHRRDDHDRRNAQPGARHQVALLRKRRRGPGVRV